MRCEVQTPGCPGDAGWGQNSEGFRASKSGRDVWSPFSHSMRRSFCQLLMVFCSSCHVCTVVKVNGFHRRFRQEQLGLLRIFGCNKQRREKRVCSHFVCLSFLPLIWTLQVMLSDTGCAQIEFFLPHPFRFMSRFLAKLTFWPLRRNAVIKQLVRESGVKSQLGVQTESVEA